MTDVSLNKTVLSRNIKFVAESLLAFLFDYNFNKFAIFQDDDKLIVVPSNRTFTNAEIKVLTELQERVFEIEILR